LDTGTLVTILTTTSTVIVMTIISTNMGIAMTITLTTSLGIAMLNTHTYLQALTAPLLPGVAYLLWASLVVLSLVPPP
jgi:hypothetical protein